MFFEYGKKEISYLKKKDRRLGEVIDKVGKIRREVDEDLFSSVVYQIAGQQISAKAFETVRRRIIEGLGEVNCQSVISAGKDSLNGFGLSSRKSEYIMDFAQKVSEGSFDLEGLWHKSDKEVIKELSSLKGVGVWTAEMVLIFCMQRPDILSFGDFGILKGMGMVYHHRKIDRKLFEKYRRRLSPYCTTASLYFWAAAGGEVPGLKDYAPKQSQKK